ncbi:MAG: kynureninase [Bacteroidota bacterium]
MPTNTNQQTYAFSLDFARRLDRQDALSSYRDAFHIPQHNEQDVLYFCGNSLGLQPKAVQEALLFELDQWRELGVEGHFNGPYPWKDYHKFLQPQSAAVVGAKKDEVVVMNTLTTNLHLLMVSFYRPTKERFKIIMEGGAFPSDQYAMESQVRFHGFDPEEAIVEVQPRSGEFCIRTEDILQTIETCGNQVALVIFGGVNYFSGQFYDLEQITKVGHKVGANVGFDLAHAAGNVPMQLHDWGVDFAVWCSYKYLNSGPGGPSGLFVHERHAHDDQLPRFAGWWGHDEENRFLMRKGFIPMEGAAGWQLSNAQILSFAAHRASLDIFAKAGMEALRQKSILLTDYLKFILQQVDPEGRRFKIISPEDPAQRGCQLSVLIASGGTGLFDHLKERGVICDLRMDNLLGRYSGVIRFAPVPLYNRFEDVCLLGKEIEAFLKQ